MIGVSIVSVTLSPRDAWRCVLAPILEYALINIFPTRFQCLIVEKNMKRIFTENCRAENLRKIWRKPL